MDSAVAIRTMMPILLLMGLGFFARKIKILKQGDERPLNAYVYYFALPALFLVDLAETKFTAENLRFVITGIAPIIMILAIYGLGYLILRFPKNEFYLLVVSTVFGSLAFFGIPFIIFAFPEAEYLATLSAASISIVSVPVSILILELFRLEKSKPSESLKRLAKRLLKNPLIISIFFGTALSFLDVEIPSLISSSLHMLGSTTAPIAIFLLGVFLYGRKYTNMVKAAQLSLIRIMLLPIFAVLVTYTVGLGNFERVTIVLMHGTPIAISSIVLSERYNFHKDTIASILLISSLAAGLTMNLWLLLLGY